MLPAASVATAVKVAVGPGPTGTPAAVKLDPVTAASIPLTLTVTADASVTPPDTVMRRFLRRGGSGRSGDRDRGCGGVDREGRRGGRWVSGRVLDLRAEGVAAVREGEARGQGDAGLRRAPW